MRGTPEPLRLLQIIARYGEVSGGLTLHKLVYAMQLRRLVDLSYRFINYSFGPYSKELEEDLKLLQRLGLVTKEKRGRTSVIKLTKKGVEVVKSLGQFRSQSRVMI